jgi:hypothetical protein
MKINMLDSIQFKKSYIVQLKFILGKNDQVRIINRWWLRLNKLFFKNKWNWKQRKNEIDPWLPELSAFRTKFQIYNHIWWWSNF